MLYEHPRLHVIAFHSALWLRARGFVKSSLGLVSLAADAFAAYLSWCTVDASAPFAGALDHG